MANPEYVTTANLVTANEYLSLPKGIGDVPVETLLRVADNMLFINRETIPTNLPNQQKLIAASCLIEAALISPNAVHDDIENQLGYIDAATSLFSEVSQHEYEKLENGFRHPDDIEGWLRAEIQTYYANTYRDMVCGEITAHHTIPQLIYDLERMADFIAVHQRQPYVPTTYKQIDAGLHAEVNVLLNSARQYSLDHPHIALPSTQRGGNGRYRSRDTHDVMIARQTDSLDDNKWRFQYREIKSGKAFSLQNLGRYSHPIIHVEGGIIKNAA